MTIINYKRFFAVLITLFVFAVSCRKSESVSPIHYTQGRVLEAKTNKPIAGATVTLQKCVKSSIDWGCIRFADVLITSTDSDGVYQYDNSLNVTSVSVSHLNYWSWTSDYPSGTLFMIPYACFKLHLKNIGNTYSPLAKIQVGVSNPDNVNIFSVNFLNYSSTTINHLPRDSAIYLTGFGNNENDVYWNITDGNTTSSNEFPRQMPNAFDTVRLELDY